MSCRIKAVGGALVREEAAGGAELTAAVGPPGASTVPGGGTGSSRPSWCLDGSFGKSPLFDGRPVGGKEDAGDIVPQDSRHLRPQGRHG